MRAKLKDTRGPQRGFILMPVILLITLLATVIFLLTRENASGIAMATKEAEKNQALYVAEAGIQHAIWQARQANCGTYGNLTNHSFGDDRYSVVVAPDTGSPINLQSTSMLASGATAAMRAVDVPIYSITATSSIVLQPGPEGKDAYIKHDDKNYGASPIFEVKDNRRALIQFDLSELPAGSIVTDARLGLYMEHANGFTDETFSLYRLNRDWVEGDMDDEEPPPGGGVTYEEYDGSNAWTTEGGDFDAAPVASVTLPAGNLGWKEWVVTDQVQDWHEGDSNHGFLLFVDRKGGHGNADVDFTSGDGVADRRPKLSITYAGCECGKECVFSEAGSCNADFEPVLKDFEFGWVPDTGELTGIDFLAENMVVNGVTIPAGGAWITIDRGEESFIVTDSQGTELTSFPSDVEDPRGIAYVQRGAWTSHLAVADDDNHAIHFMNLDGDIEGSISTELIAEEPVGLTFIGATDSGSYENHLAFTSKKNGGGEIYIVDQNGAVVKIIDVDSFAPKPQGVAHLPGADKLMVTDLDGAVSIIDFDGVVLRQYDVATWALSDMRGTTIHPQTCEHVVIDTNIELVTGLKPFDVSESIPPDLLMVVANSISLTTQEEAKKTLIENWGYSVTTISDSASSASYDAEVAINDVVYIGEDVSASAVGTKLRAVPIGVVNEDASLSDEFGLSSSISWSSGTTFSVVDTGHYISQPFATGPLQILVSSSGLAGLSGAQAPGLEVLASTGAGSMLTTLEAGAEMFDSSAAAGRRAFLPWADGSFELGNLNDDGRTIFKRALEWAAQPPVRCDADYVANEFVSDFPWMPATNDIHGIDYLPAGLVVNSVSIPVGGGWIMSDPGADRMFFTDIAGNPLTDFPITPKDAQGVALVEAGPWANHFAVADKDQDRVYYLDRDGGIAWSFVLAGITDNPLGLGYVSSSASATYDNHFLVSSDKDPTGHGTATVSFVDQWGVLAKYIDIEAHAPNPLGIEHVNGADKLVVTDKAGMVSVVDFDGLLLRQYAASEFGLVEVSDIAVNPVSCDHVFVQKKDFENIASLNRNTGDGSPRYFELFMPWSVVTPDTWESVNLDIYGIPKNSVVEMAIINNDGNELWGGVRTGGSSLDRRLQLHERDGGVDMMVMHVQVDANGVIELYADAVDKVTFVILGYWIETNYVENWQSFKAGGSAGWQDHALSGYGVGSNDVADILMVNNAGFNERKAGVRMDGTFPARIVDLHEAMDGGDEAVSLMTPAGADGNATIEVYAENDADIDFILLGHWSSPPGTFIQDFNDLGVPLVEEVWEEKDLSPEAVPANAVVQILAANSEHGKGVWLGARSTDKSHQRMFQLHKATNGGDEVFTTHVNVDDDGMIQWYVEDRDLPRSFYLLGWWLLAP